MPSLRVDRSARGDRRRRRCPAWRDPARGGPLRFALAAGRHHVEVTLAGHAPQSRPITAEFGEAGAFSFTLRPTYAMVDVSSNARGTRVHVDGRYIGMAPQSLDVLPGRHTLRAWSPGYVERALVVDAVAGTRERIVLDLGRSPAKAPSWSGGAFAAAIGGASRTDYGPAAPFAATGFGVQVGVLGGHRWRRGRLAISAHGALLGTSAQQLDDDGTVDDAAMLLGLAGGGGALFVRRQLWIEAAVSLGGTFVVGASPQSFLRAAPGDGLLAAFTVRSSLSVGWTIWRGLTARVTPIAVDFSPTHDAFDARVTRILRLHVGALAIGWYG